MRGRELDSVSFLPERLKCLIVFLPSMVLTGAIC